MYSRCVILPKIRFTRTINLLFKKSCSFCLTSFEIKTNLHSQIKLNSYVRKSYTALTIYLNTNILKLTTKRARFVYYYLFQHYTTHVQNV